MEFFFLVVIQSLNLFVSSKFSKIYSFFKRIENLFSALKSNCPNKYGRTNVFTFNQVKDEMYEPDCI